MSSGTDMMISTTLASVCLSMRRIGVCGVVVFYRERRGIGAIGTLHRDAPKPHPIRLLLHGQSQTAERVKLVENLRRPILLDDVLCAKRVATGRAGKT